MKDNICLNDSIIQTINNNNPLYQIKRIEFDDILLKFGSLISMLKNKRINQTMLLIELLENEKYVTCFKSLSGIDESSVLFYNLVVRFPVLYKSKIIKTKIAELHDKQKGKRSL